MERTEDEVRDFAKTILEFDKSNKDVMLGAGQLTTFNTLYEKAKKEYGFILKGFKGIKDSCDGWYLPKIKSQPAIILETKSEKQDISKSVWVDQLLKCVDIASKEYKYVIGILYNGIDIRVFKGHEEIIGLSTELQNKKYYLSLFENTPIDKNLIYTLTARINNTLHNSFGIKNLYHRMIFTACALVAVKEGATLYEGMEYDVFHQAILSQLNKSLKEAKKQNQKLELLSEVYADIKMNRTDNQEAIDNFIKWVKQISEHINSRHWHGEDVMGIFFNEFNRYKPKSESGQIFTPDHITDFMYKLIDVNQDDYVLDAACGSGGFLVKSMANMMYEAGGPDTSKSKKIKSSQLYGIEFDREIFALACANMLIHKDGKTNIEQLDTRSDEACKWIKSQTKITKVLMNPPYERKYGCLTIVKNVLDNVPIGTKCAFILPDKKLEKDFKDKKYGNKLLKNHRLIKIIKMPENLFFGVGVTTSIFIIEAGKPQNGQEIFACYMEDDGLETVKNQGRHDVRGKWAAIEEYWVDVMHKQRDIEYHTDQWIKPSEHLSYQMPENPFEIYEEDFIKTAMDYLMFQRGIDVKDFGEKLLSRTMYSGTVSEKEDSVVITLERGDTDED